MKKFLFAFTALLISYIVMAQAPGIFNYQGVARNSVGNVLVNKTLTLRLTIHNLSATGAIVYQETRQTTTNPFGLFYVQVGDGNATNITGTIATVPWTTGAKYIQVEIDPNGGTSFINAGTVQLASVPYAVSAATANPVGPAGGSLTGNYPDPVIANGAVTQPMIAPGVTLPPSGPAGGSLTGTYPNPTIANGAVTQIMIDPSVTFAPTGPAGGSLTGTYPNPTIANGAVTSAMLAGNVAWVPGGNNLAAVQPLGTISNFDLPFITNNIERMRLLTDGNLGIGTLTPAVKLEIGDNSAGATTAIALRASTSVNSFTSAGFSNYNGGVIQSTYPGGLTGQTLNIVATGSNTGNWPSNIDFWTRNNGGTNANVKMRLLNNGRLDLGNSTTGDGVAISLRTATTVTTFDAADFSDYNGSVIQSTYPGGLTGQTLNIVAAGSNSGNWPSNIDFWTRSNGGTNANVKMRLMNTGRLEIGSSTAGNGTAITIKAATSVSTFPTASYADYNGGVIQSTYPAGSTGQVLNISASGSNSGNWPSNIAFWTRVNGGSNAAERVRISDEGFVGIGCTDPKYPLQVVGDIAASGGTLRAASAVISTTITACSDMRYKKNIAPLENALENVLQLRGVSYNWKVNEFPDKYFNNKNQIGIIAQELEKIYPELVETDAQGYKTVDYSKMTPVLIESIKEQQVQIKKQQAEIDGLKKDMEELKKLMGGLK